MCMSNAGVDRRLLEYVSQRVIELSRQPFLRQGAVDFDNEFAVSVHDAVVRVEIAKMIVANPRSAIRYAHMGYVPNDWNGKIVGFIE